MLSSCVYSPIKRDVLYCHSPSQEIPGYPSGWGTQESRNTKYLGIPRTSRDKYEHLPRIAGCKCCDVMVCMLRAMIWVILVGQPEQERSGVMFISALHYNAVQSDSYTNSE